VTVSVEVGDSATCRGEVTDVDHETRMSRGNLGVSIRDMSRWFRKIPRQVGDKPACGVVLIEFRNEHEATQHMTNGVWHVADLSYEETPETVDITEKSA